MTATFLINARFRSTALHNGGEPVTRKSPRIPPLPRAEWTDEARDVFAYWEGPVARENGSRSNTMRTLAQHPRLAIASLDFGKYILIETKLTARQRELIVLRVAWRYRSEHQWTHHVLSGRKIGMTDAEFSALQQLGTGAVWTVQEQALIDAVDQLCTKGQIDDATWALLATAHDRRTLMDMLYAIGLFTMNAWAFNAMGIELEPDVASYSKPADELVRALER
jgi:4-carboxymuconolactone decarboxylase